MPPDAPPFLARITRDLGGRLELPEGVETAAVVFTSLAERRMVLEHVMPWSGRLKRLVLDHKFAITMDVPAGVRFDLADSGELTGHGLTLEPGSALELYVEDCDGRPPVGFLLDAPLDPNGEAEHRRQVREMQKVGYGYTLELVAGVGLMCGRCKASEVKSVSFGVAEYGFDLCSTCLRELAAVADSTTLDTPRVDVSAVPINLLARTRGSRSAG